MFFKENTWNISVEYEVLSFFLVEELITPALNGLILPGITRKSLLTLAREWVKLHHKLNSYCFLCHAVMRSLGYYQFYRT